MSALDVVRLPIPPVEVVIALSVVYLSMEIALQKKDTLTYSYPIAVSLSFGLLHGFGFAAVLSDIGLPQIEIVSSLLFFNVGVELGQIIFVRGILLLWLFIRKIFFDKNLNSKFKFRGLLWKSQQRISAVAWLVSG